MDIQKAKGVLEKITLNLKDLSKDPGSIRDYSKFHKDGKIHKGISTSLVRKIALKGFKEIKNLKKGEVFSLCERLLAIKESEQRKIAFDWAFRLRKNYQKQDFRIFERWLKKYVKTWGSCDDLCTHAFGEFIYQFPEFLPQTKEWSKSENKWLRRACAVVLIYPLRKGRYLEEALSVARILLRDSENLVQKGYGWMLKEASNLHQKKVFDFVIANKKLMPRTALRYAIEKLPEKLRTIAIQKE